MKPLMVTPFEVAKRFEGMKEVSGAVSNPGILAMLQLDQKWPQDDAVPWCSAFVNYICMLLGLQRSKSLMARSWLAAISGAFLWENAEIGFDVVILKRGGRNQPGPEILNAPGHVGFFAGWAGDNVLVLGGNQADGVNVSAYPKSRILGIRRLEIDN